MGTWRVLEQAWNNWAWNSEPSLFKKGQTLRRAWLKPAFIEFYENVCFGENLRIHPGTIGVGRLEVLFAGGGEKIGGSVATETPSVKENVETSQDILPTFASSAPLFEQALCSLGAHL